VRSKSSRTKAIKTKKKRRVFFPVYLFKIGSIRCNTQVSTCFQLLHGVRKVFCAGRSRLSESPQLYQILHPSAATSPSGTGSSRGEKIWRIWEVVQRCDLFLSQKLSNFCCRMRRDVVVQEEKNHECGTGGDELVECETVCAIQKLLFDLMLHHRKPPKSVPQPL